jgi:hypothetical protein
MPVWCNDIHAGFTLKIEAICSSETSVETRRSTWRHIPEHDTLHIHLSLMTTGSKCSGGGGKDMYEQTQESVFH